jgi:flagellar basal-body rod protein FlgB
MLDPIASRLESYMDLLATRQKLVASNIANIDTPGYHTRDIDFQFEFLSQMDAPPGTAGETAAIPQVIEPQGLATKNDGNNVSLDRESRLLAENALRFNLASTLLKTEVRNVRDAINEGRTG